MEIQKAIGHPFYTHNRDRVLYGAVIYSMVFIVLNLYLYFLVTSDTVYLCI